MTIEQLKEEHKIAIDFDDNYLYHISEENKASKNCTKVTLDFTIKVLMDIANKIKTHKVGNSGSWYDAAVDRTPIIDKIKELQNNLK